MLHLIGWLVRDGISKRMVFELRPKGGEWGNHLKCWEKRTLGHQNKEKGLDMEKRVGSWKDRGEIGVRKHSELKSLCWEGTEKIEGRQVF